MGIDKAKDVRATYDKAISAFKKKMNNSNKEEITLTIEKIEKYKESYRMDDVQKKVNLGKSILFGLLIMAVGFDIGTKEYFDFTQEIVRNIALGAFSIGGIYTMLKGLGHYVSDGKANQEFAEDTLSEIAEDYRRIK